MLARARPDQAHFFSTLEPLLNTQPSNDDESSSFGDMDNSKRFPPHHRVSKTPMDDFPLDNTGTASRTGSTTDALWTEAVAAATTLEAGAIPVREMPDTLASEPASMAPSSASSQVDEGDIPTPIQDHGKAGSVTSTTSSEELRCVIAVVRHGDRTPKQKHKVNTSEPQILDYFEKHATNCKKDVKVKARAPMIEFLETVKQMIEEKQLQHQVPMQKELLLKLLHMRDILERWKIVGLNRKLQIKPRKWEEVTDPTTGETRIRCTDVQLILKWGGNLTKLGE